MLKIIRARINLLFKMTKSKPTTEQRPAGPFGSEQMLPHPLPQGNLHLSGQTSIDPLSFSIS